MVLTDGLRRRETSPASTARPYQPPSRRRPRTPGDTRPRLPTGAVGRWETPHSSWCARLVASSSRAFADTTGRAPRDHSRSLRSTATEHRLGVGQPAPGEPARIEVRPGDPRCGHPVTVVAGLTRGDATSVARGDRCRSPQSTPASERGGGRRRPTRETAAAGPAPSPGERPDPASSALAEVQVPGPGRRPHLGAARGARRLGGPRRGGAAADRPATRVSTVEDDVRCATGRATGGRGGRRLDRTLRLGTVRRTPRRSWSARSGDALLGPAPAGPAPHRARLVDRGRRRPGVCCGRGRRRPRDHLAGRPDDPDPDALAGLDGEAPGQRGAAAARPADRRRAGDPGARCSHPGGRQTRRRSTPRARRASTRCGRPQLQIKVLDSGRAVSRLGDGSAERLGVGVSEVPVDGLRLLPVRLSAVPVDVGCGFGPPLRIGTSSTPPRSPLPPGSSSTATAVEARSAVRRPARRALRRTRAW